MFCGSGKKYKKCCMNKQEQRVVTPADSYIEKALRKFPKEALLENFDEERVAIDEKFYQVLKHKPIPVFVERNYMEERRRNSESMKEALNLLKTKCIKENIKNEEDFNKKIAIHYSLSEIILGYFSVIDKTSRRLYFEDIENSKIEFFIELMQIINPTRNLKLYIINNLIEDYCEDRDFIEDGVKAIKKLMPYCLEIEDYMTIQLVKLYAMDYMDIEDVLKPLDEYVSKHGTNKYIEAARIYAYSEVVLDEDYEYDDDESNLEMHKKVWKIIKDFIKDNAITSEKEYNEIQDYSNYCFSEILSRIDSFYELNYEELANQRLEFLNEAQEIMELEEETKEIIMQGFVETYCDMQEENRAFGQWDGSLVQPYENNIEKT